MNFYNKEHVMSYGNTIITTNITLATKIMMTRQTSLFLILLLFTFLFYSMLHFSSNFSLFFSHHSFSLSFIHPTTPSLPPLLLLVSISSSTPSLSLFHTTTATTHPLLFPHHFPVFILFSLSHTTTTLPPPLYLSSTHSLFSLVSLSHHHHSSSSLSPPLTTPSRVILYMGKCFKIHVQSEGLAIMLIFRNEKYLLFRQKSFLKAKEDR